HGNNNAYCQDNELSWYDWDLDAEQRALLEFTRRLIALRREHPVLRQAEFLQGIFLPEADIKDVTWIKVDGTEMTPAEWRDGGALLSDVGDEYPLGARALAVLRRVPPDETPAEGPTVAYRRRK